MRSIYSLLFVLFCVLIDDCSSYRLHEVKYSKLVRVRREDVKILKTGHLPDGTKYERIQESGVDLPPLPIEEEVEDLSDSRIGQLDDQGEVLIPVDEHGNPLPGYEYILKPIVIEINSEKHGNILNDLKVVHNLPSSEVDSVPKVFNPTNGNSGNVPRYDKPADRIEEEAGDDYEEETELDKSGQSDIPNLPPVDYKDSGETDDNLKPMSDEKKESDLEIEIPSNRHSDPQPVDINYSEGETNGQNQNQNQETVLKPERGELGEPIPFQPQKEEEEEAQGIDNGAEVDAGQEEEESENEKTAEEKAPNVDSLDDLTESDIEELANGFQKEIYNKIMGDANGEFDENEDELVPKGNGNEKTIYEAYPDPKLAQIGDGAAPQPDSQPAPNGKEVIDGFVLEDSELTEEERQNILRASEGKTIETPSPATKTEDEKKVVRGGRIGPKPSSAFSSTYSIITLVSFILFAVL